MQQAVLAKAGVVDNQQVSTGGSYHGFSARATGAGYATVRDGSVSGPILGHIEFTAAGQKEFFISNGIIVGGGIFINTESGTIPTITIYYSN